MRQMAFNFTNNYKKEFGGSLLPGKRKSMRPISTKHSMHLVLKSNQRGIFNPTNRSLHELLHQQAKKFDIKIYDLAINWSHIHILFRVKHRADYLKFIRALTSIIAVQARSFNSNFKQIFTLRPFTRIVRWGRDFKNALSYHVLNQLEALGLVKRRSQGRKVTRGQTITKNREPYTGKYLKRNP